MPTFLTPRQVAERWGCSARHVRRLCASGDLVAMRLGLDAWRIAVSAVAAYELAHTSGSDASTSSEGREAEPTTRQEVRPPAVVDGFTLPDGYEPVYPELWNLPAKTNGAASPAAGRARGAGKQKAALTGK